MSNDFPTIPLLPPTSFPSPPPPIKKQKNNTTKIFQYNYSDS